MDVRSMLVMTGYLQCCINVEVWLFSHDICKTCILVWGYVASAAVILQIHLNLSVINAKLSMALLYLLRLLC